jgi:hypothetical protein
MKNAIRVMGFAVLAALAGVATAQAQITVPMEFKTAFSFSAGNTTFPAGRFTIRPVDDNEPSVLELSNGTVTTLVVVQPQSGNANDPVKDVVVFNKYSGDQYVLSEIWDSTDQSGARTEASVVEQRHAKKHGTPAKESVTATRRTGTGSY